MGYPVGAFSNLYWMDASISPGSAVIADGLVCMCPLPVFPRYYYIYYTACNLKDRSLHPASTDDNWRMFACSGCTNYSF